MRSMKRRPVSRPQEPVDWLVRGGTVVTLDSSGKIIEDGFVAVGGDRIVAVGPGREAGGYRARRTLDARGRIVLPGLVNAHGHVAMSLFRGVSDDQELMMWLERYMFPLEAKHVDREFVFWGSLLSCWEMITSGTTTFADGYFFEDAVAEAASEAGLRAVPGQGIFDVPVPDAKNADEGLKVGEALLKKWSGHTRIHASLFPHSAFTCGATTLKRVQRLATDYRAHVQFHMAESQTELAVVRERYATTPCRFAAQAGFLRENVIAAHCVWLDDEEIKMLRDRGVSVAHCPESNMKLASGIAPVPKLLAAGITVGLGTDGPASNNNLDMFEEMSTAAKLHKVAGLNPTLVPAETALRMATIESARALGLGEITGSLEPGKQADLIVVRTDGPAALPLYHVYSHLVYSVGSQAVETSMVAGRLLLRDRKLLTLDTQLIARKAGQYRRRIARSLREL